jgi:hypothetical protein
MGLDVYAGPLTRYYAGLWKTAVQQAAEANGIEAQVIYAQGEPQRPTADEARVAVLAWQRSIQSATGVGSLSWAESADGEYFTDKPDWDGYWAVLFLAASDEFPEIAPPRDVPPPSRLEDPSTHPLIRRVTTTYQRRPAGGLQRLLGLGGSRPRDLRYPHLLRQEELWVPADFEEPLVGNDPGGNKVVIGSTLRLLEELEDLNRRTLAGDDSMLEGWFRRGPPDDDHSLRRVAEFGLAIFLQAARFSVDHSVPIRLDY